MCCSRWTGAWPCRVPLSFFNRHSMLGLFLKKDVVVLNDESFRPAQRAAYWYWRLNETKARELLRLASIRKSNCRLFHLKI